MNVLELFSGTGSVGRCCKAIGWEVISLDLLLPADHQEDIMNFDYKKYPKDHFGMIWASPPCTEYSTLKNSHIGRKQKNGEIYTFEVQEEKMKEADKLVLKTLEIIEYFNPEIWFMENPNGRLKNRPIMRDRFYHIVDYCMYSDWGYKKRTNIWTNRKNWKPLTCNKKCGNMIGTHHTNNLGNNNHPSKIFSQQDRYRIPEKLIYSLLMDM